MSTQPHSPLIRLLDNAFDAFAEEMNRRVAQTPYSDIRITHGCGADRVAALRDALEAITAERLGAIPVA
jgi:hypothetical protein